MKSSRGALERILPLLTAIVRDAGQNSLSRLANDLGLPLATAHRAAQQLQRSGYLIRSRRGYYHAGPVLAGLAPELGIAMIAAGIARPVILQLALRYDCIAHVGIFENDMVTYLLKAGRKKDSLFTREDMQLEAYCSGLGKVLLASLGETELTAYLSNGPFVGLTGKTIVEPDALQTEIASVRECGFAIDDREAEENLYCLAVPLTDTGGQVFAAISLSFRDTIPVERARNRYLQALRTAADKIRQRLG